MVGLKKLMTADELGELLRLRPETILQMARERSIPSIKLSRRAVRFVEDDVRRALEAKERCASN